MVQLKQVWIWKGLDSPFGFNSSMVQLKRNVESDKIKPFAEFQFLNGSIKAP